MEIISSGDKLTKLRKQYGIKQHELAGENISRSYIGMVEQNRRKITRNKAQEIVKNFNRILSQKETGMKIKLEDFFVEIEEELTEKTDKIIKKVKEKNVDEKFLNELKKMESEIVMNNYQNKALIYYEISSKLYNKKMYQDAIFYCEKSLDYFLEKKKVKEIGVLTDKLLDCYLFCEKYEKIEVLEYRLKPFFEKLKVEVKNNIAFNLAEGLTRLRQYKRAIVFLNTIDINSYEFINGNSVYLSLGKNYEQLKRYSEAEFYYEKASESGEFSDQLNSLVKVCLLKIKQNSVSREIKIRYMQIKKIEKQMKNLTAEELYSIAKIAYYLDEFDEGIEFLDKALNSAENTEITLKIIDLDLKISSKSNPNIIDKLENKYFEILNYEDRYDLVASFSKYYLNNEMYEKNKDFINKVYSVQSIECD